MDKYFSGNYPKFQVTSQDGTFNETIRINGNLVKDSMDCVAFLKTLYESDIADKMFEVFMEFCLMQGLKDINKNRDLIIKASGESNGNEDIKKD